MGSNRRRTYRSGVILLLLISVVFLTGCTAILQEKIVLEYEELTRAEGQQSKSVELHKEGSEWIDSSSGESVAESEVNELKRILTNRTAAESVSEYQNALEEKRELLQERKSRIRKEMVNISQLLDKEGENMSSEERREYRQRLEKLEESYERLYGNMNMSGYKFEAYVEDHFSSECRMRFTHNTTSYRVTSVRDECSHDTWKVQTDEGTYVVRSERVTEIFYNITDPP